ncbi:hypothetical protein DOE76_14430 [Leifsonia sp. ku-ls]|nr:hypothetical protein DOE76_14430 [Leifsonia sp. ku-ls]
MERLQPYQPHEGTSFLKTLHALDIQDKHRGLLSGRVNVAVDIEGLRFDAIRFSPQQLATMRVEPSDEPVEISDGAYLGALALPGVLQPDEFETTLLTVRLEFLIEFDGYSIPLPQIQATFPSLTLSIHKAVLGISTPDDATEWTNLAPV